MNLKKQLGSRFLEDKKRGSSPCGLIATAASILPSNLISDGVSSAVIETKIFPGMSTFKPMIHLSRLSAMSFYSECSGSAITGSLTSAAVSEQVLVDEDELPSVWLDKQELVLPVGFCFVSDGDDRAGRGDEEILTVPKDRNGDSESAFEHWQSNALPLLSEEQVDAIFRRN